MIAAVLFAGVTCLMSFLAAVSAGTAKCAGQASLAGYRREVLDFWAWPLFSIAIVIIIAAIRNSETVAKEVGRVLATFDLEVLEIFSMRITFGMFLIYAPLCGLVLFNGVMVGISVARYNAVSSYCYQNPG
jgi:hypothetical protein